MKTINAVWMVNQAKSFPDFSERRLAVQLLDQRATDDAWRGLYGFTFFFTLMGLAQFVAPDNIALRQQIMDIGKVLALAEFLDAGFACAIYNDVIENMLYSKTD